MDIVLQYIGVDCTACTLADMVFCRELGGTDEIAMIFGVCFCQTERISAVAALEFPHKP